MDELLPQDCPFCKSKAVVHATYNNERFYVHCSIGLDCGAMGPSRPTSIEAIQLWNSIVVRNSAVAS